MANVVRRYQRTLSVIAMQLTRRLPSGTFVSSSVPEPGEMIDITVSNTDANYATDLNDLMLTEGFNFVSEGPVTTLEFAASGEVPPITRIRESGGTELAIGAVSTGQVLRRSGASVIGSSVPLQNGAAIVDPVSTDDNTLGYGVGSQWINTVTNLVFIATSVGTGAALWSIVPPINQRAFATGNITTSSTTFVLVTGMSVIPAAKAGFYLVSFSSSVDLTVSPAQGVRVVIYVSGAGTGTVGVTNGLNTVTGSGTNFLSAYVVGQNVQFASQAGTFYTINTIPSNTSMTLTVVFSGATNASTNINLMSDSGSEIANSDTAGFNQPFMCMSVVYVNSTQQIEGRWRVTGGGATATMYVSRSLIVQRVK